jgi:hypothetical protein
LPSETCRLERNERGRQSGRNSATPWNMRSKLLSFLDRYVRRPVLQIRGILGYVNEIVFYGVVGNRLLDLFRSVVNMTTCIAPITWIDKMTEAEISKRVRRVQRIISRERIRLARFGNVRIDAQELIRARVVVAVDSAVTCIPLRRSR